MTVSPIHGAHRYLVSDLDFSADGRFLISIGDSAARVWAVPSGRALGQFVLPTHDPEELALAPQGNTALIGTRSGAIYVLQIDSVRQLQVLDDCEHVSNLFMLPDGGVVAVCSLQGTRIHYWQSNGEGIPRRPSTRFKFTHTVHHIAPVGVDSLLISHERSRPALLALGNGNLSPIATPCFSAIWTIVASADVWALSGYQCNHNSLMFDNGMSYVSAGLTR
jgi:WD40 repeat protein